MAGGRPRAFDADQALDKALTVFWQKGYGGTSLPDLTEAMGINRPSLYAAFGNKEQLFLKVLARYGERMGCMVQALDKPLARDAVEALLTSVIDKQTTCDGPKGCLMVQGALSGGDTAEKMRAELSRRRAAGETALRDRLERAQAEGELPDSTDVATLAKYYSTILSGLAVQAAGGASGDDLRALVPFAMRAWPG